MNLTTEDYEKINNLIQTNEDENKAIAAGAIANMDEEQVLEWLQSFIDLYYPAYVKNPLQFGLGLEIDFFDTISIRVHMSKTHDVHIIDVVLLGGSSFFFDIGGNGLIDNYLSTNKAEKIKQAFKDLFK